MRVLNTVAVWLVVAAHFAFLIYLPSGGFLALRWRRTIWLHVLAVSLGIGSIALQFWCPLTALEQLLSVTRHGSPPRRSGRGNHPRKGGALFRRARRARQHRHPRVLYRAARVRRRRRR